MGLQTSGLNRVQFACFIHALHGQSQGISQWPIKIQTVDQKRDAREVQRYILSLIQGAPNVKPKVTKVIHALLDFIYTVTQKTDS